MILFARNIAHVVLEPFFNEHYNNIYESQLHDGTIYSIIKFAFEQR